MTRILLVNPNMSQAMTDRLAAVARSVVGPETEIAPLTARWGFPYISSRAEAQIAGAIALEMIAEHRAGADAAVIAAYGDPGLKAARELFDIPVVGMAEAAMLTACMLGETFGVVTFTARMTPWYHDGVTDVGLLGRFAGFRAPPDAVGSVTEVAHTMRDALLGLARESALSDGADAVILAGAPLAGLAPALADLCPAVLVDPVAAAVRQAETLARLAPRGACFGRHARPPGKPSQGLAAPLASLIAAGAAP